MILFYLAGLSSILFATGKFLMRSNLNLEKSKDFIRVLCSFLAIYLYLTSFLAIYVWKEAKLYPEYLAKQVKMEQIKHSNYSSYSNFCSEEQIFS